MAGLNERRDQDPGGVVREERGGGSDEEETGGAFVHHKPRRSVVRRKEQLSCNATAVQPSRIRTLNPGSEDPTDE